MWNGKDAPSSSSSVAEGLLSRAFDVLSNEAPAHAALLREALRAVALRLRVGSEDLMPTVEGHQLVVTASRAPYDVEVRASLRAALDLLEGRSTLLRMIESRRVEIKGPVGKLHDASRVFHAFLHGLVRSPSGTELLAELRTAVEPTGEENT